MTERHGQTVQDESFRRRQILAAAGTAITGGLAGCNTGTDSRPHTGTTTDASPPASTGTETSTDRQAPAITAYRATPRQDGTVLHVYMAGEDDRELQAARVAYGGRELARQPDGTQVTVDGRLQDTAVATDEDGKVLYALTDAAGNATRKHVQPDDTAPSLSVSGQPTEHAGEAALTIDAQEDTGLAEVATLLDADAVQTTDVTGRQQYSAEETVTAPEQYRFQHTPVGARARDWNGNTTEQDVQTYVRKYDVMDDLQYDIGVTYTPQTGAAFQQGCVVRKTPEVGDYQDPIRPETTSQHIDQMTGHGINRVIYVYTGFHNAPERMQSFLESSMIDQVEIHPEIDWNVFKHSMDESWKDTVLPETGRILRENILNRGNVATHEGRPRVRMWAAHAYALNEEARSKIMEEWGSYDAFVDDVRNQLTVDGSEPYLAGGFGLTGWTDYEAGDVGDFAALFDGVFNWTGPINSHTGETWAWEDVFPLMQEGFEMHHDFATSHGVDYIPTAFPGFDDRGEDCYPPAEKRHIPRSLDRFQQMLSLAEESATTDMINIATWNSWSEGTQIEPGTHRGTDYGTDYLDVIEEFQSG